MPVADPKDFSARVTALEAKLSTERFDAVASLRMIEEEWARQILGLRLDGKLVADVRRLVERGLDPYLAEDAASHLERAEKWQWEIGTWSSGSGEGLASMFEVRCLQLARAWLFAAGVCRAPGLADEARKLAREVTGDPNRIAKSEQAHADALGRFLSRA